MILYTEAGVHTNTVSEIDANIFEVVNTIQVGETRGISDGHWTGVLLSALLQQRHDTPESPDWGKWK